MTIRGSSPPVGGGRAVTMYTIYVLYNKNNSKIYIGQTDDLRTRLKLHKDKIFMGYTSRFNGNWELIYSEVVDTRFDALRREKQLKSYRGREFVKKYIPG